MQSRKEYNQRKYCVSYIERATKKRKDSSISLHSQTGYNCMSRSLVRWSSVDWFSLLTSRYLCPR